MPVDLPAEEFTFLFTDVEGSTKLWETDPDRMGPAMAWHDAALRSSVERCGGAVVKMTGDGAHAVFSDPREALLAALQIQLELGSGRSPASVPLSVRCGLHRGKAQPRDNDYFGSVVNRAARIMGTAHGGQILLSEAVVEQISGRLPDQVTLIDLGEVRLRDLSSPEHVYQAAHAQLRQEFPALRSLESHPNNLDQQPSSFIGRERELKEICGLIQSTRLVTLVGMGGLGKTRLALQCGADLLDSFSDGVWLVDLAQLTDPLLVANEVAKVLGVREEPGRSLAQTLNAHLKSRTLLLILDGCERLAATSAKLADAVVRGTRNVRILVTSREPLRAPGEHQYPVLPLTIPRHGAGVEELSRSTAVQLFVERAQSHKPNFVLTEREVSAVAELVIRLEGIPLALELAAARVRSLSVADINLRLKDRYKLLTQGSPLVHARQQTLRALVDWSYDLLQEKERALLARLSIFSGGFSLSAAESICGDTAVPGEEILDLVASLVDKSMLMVDEGESAARYRMLETIRDYAREKLLARGEWLPIATRHCEFFFALAKQARDGMRGPEQSAWIRRLEVDLDNVRAAMALSLTEQVDAFIAVKIAVALQGFWIWRGYVTEGRGYLRDALALPSVQASDEAQGWALYVDAALAESQGDHVEARTMLEKCLELRQRLGQKSEIAGALSTLANAMLRLGDADGALTNEREAIRLFRELGSQYGEAVSLLHLGEIHTYLGDHLKAKSHLEQSLLLARAIKNQEIEGECEWELGALALASGDSRASYRHSEASLAVFRNAADRHGEAVALWGLGKADIAAGSLDSARVRLSEALRAFQEFGMFTEAFGCLEDHATLMTAHGATRDAVRLLAAATSGIERLAIVPSASDRQRKDSAIKVLLKALGHEAFENAWAEGRNWGIEEAVALTG